MEKIEFVDSKCDSCGNYIFGLPRIVEGYNEDWCKRCFEQYMANIRKPDGKFPEKK